MKIVITQKALKAALEIPKQVSGKSDKDFTEQLHFSFKDKVIKIAAYNNSLESSIFIVATSVENPEPFSVNAKRVFDLVRGYKGVDELIIESIDGSSQLLFKKGRSRQKVDICSSASDYPTMSGVDISQSHFTVNLDQFYESLISVAWAIQKEGDALSSTAFLNNVKCKLLDDRLAFTSSDKYKCCSGSLACTINKSEAKEVLIPKRLIDLIGHVKGFDVEKIEVFFNNSHMKLVVPNVGFIISSICSQIYADIDLFFNTPMVVEAVVKKQDVVEAINRFASGINDVRKSGVRLQLTNNALEIMDTKTDSVEIIDAAITGNESADVSEKQLGIQLKMLSESLSNTRSEEIVIGLSEKIPLNKGHNTIRVTSIKPIDSPYSMVASCLEFMI
jgi:DNA polymerase III subunit beta